MHYSKNTLNLSKELNDKFNKFSNNKGNIKIFETGGEVNNKHSFPIFPNGLDEWGLTEIQTEIGEVAHLPDKTIVDVKADKLHKYQHGDNISDIFPKNTYIFSRDPRMRFSGQDKIQGVALKDMTLGKEVYKYNENDKTSGPKDIMLSDYFFNGNNKKSFTSSDIASNIKKNFPMVDLKDDLYADRAIEENADQRSVYLDILRSFSEFKRPKNKEEKQQEKDAKMMLQQIEQQMMMQQMMGQQQDMNPEMMENPNMQEQLDIESQNNEQMNPLAQYGSFIQPTQQGFEGMLGYSRANLDPYKKMDNNFKSMFNLNKSDNFKISNPYNNFSYANGGEIPKANVGDLVGELYDGFAGLFGGGSKKAERDQRRKNEILAKELAGYQKDLQSGVDRSGMYNMLGTTSSYLAGLNVPDQRYDDFSEQQSLLNAHANRARQLGEASKYTSSQGIGSASSLARYNNPANYTNYLSQVQSQSDSNVAKVNEMLSNLDRYRYEQSANYTTLGNQARNAALNTKANQLYNVNVQGMSNIGQAASNATLNSSNTKYQLGTEKLAYDNYLDNLAKQAKNEKKAQINRVANGVVQAAAIATGAGAFGTSLAAKNAANMLGNASGIYTGNLQGFDNPLSDPNTNGFNGAARMNNAVNNLPRTQIQSQRTPLLPIPPSNPPIYLRGTNPYIIQGELPYNSNMYHYSPSYDRWG